MPAEPTGSAAHGPDPSEPRASARAPSCATSPEARCREAARGGPRRPRRSFLQRTLEELLAFLEDALFAERIAAVPGLLQSFDARAKLLFGVCLAVGLTSVHAALPLALALLLALPAASRSGIRPALLVARVWPVTLGFTALLALPAAVSWVRPGAPLLQLWTFADGETLDVTRPGLEGVLTLSLRVSSVASWMTALLLTTRWDRALSALRSLGVPAAFRLVALLSYRYLFLLCDLVRSEHLARESRTPHLPGRSRAGGAEERGWVAARIGALLLRANQASEEVYLAMQARGAGIAIRTLTPPAWRARDAGLALLGLVLLVASVAAGR
ncbi:MAG: cobalt ECF transporter T component CbiQ [Planctomycetes bacterium]|nr:cobalt ECF transporter T component CbiQ [Planctomycetota bacterium]